MSAGMWLSISMGSGLGVLYMLASLLTARFAAGQPNQQFMLLFFGGMIARMGVALTLMALVLLLVPVRQGPFVAAFLILFVIGLAAEVFLFHRRAA